MTAPRRIAVVTGTRAEYGLLYWLIRSLHEDADVELQLVATGMHLSPDFGLTVQDIEQDGFPIADRVEMLLSSDTPEGITKSIGLGTIGFADCFRRLRPDVLVVLGDRFEILAAAQAAMIARIPIAHLHGGESTFGLIDEAIRHAVTKMAHLHFVATEVYGRRVIQMGEHPDRVFVHGTPGLDHLTHMDWMSREELSRSLTLELGSPLFLVTYHPVTLDAGSIEAMEALTTTLDAFPEASVIFTYPNADTGGRALIERIEAWVARNPGRATAAVSLGQRRYLSAMRLADVVIGNSSSGLTEAPALRRPTVNLGERQDGRLKADSVVDCPERSEDIVAAIRRALSPEMQGVLASLTPVYGESGASAKIAHTLKTHPLEGLIKKRFYDL